MLKYLSNPIGYSNSQCCRRKYFCSTFASKWSPGFCHVGDKLPGVEPWPQYHNLVYVYQAVVSHILSRNIRYLLFQPGMWSCFYCTLATNTESDVNVVRKEVWREIARFALINITCNQPSHCWERWDGYYFHPVDLTAFFRSTFLIFFGQNSLMMWRVSKGNIFPRNNKPRQRGEGLTREPQQLFPRLCLAFFYNGHWDDLIDR